MTRGAQTFLRVAKVFDESKVRRRPDGRFGEGDSETRPDGKPFWEEPENGAPYKLHEWPAPTVSDEARDLGMSAADELKVPSDPRDGVEGARVAVFAVLDAARASPVALWVMQEHPLGMVSAPKLDPDLDHVTGGYYDTDGKRIAINPSRLGDPPEKLFAWGKSFGVFDDARGARAQASGVLMHELGHHIEEVPGVTEVVAAGWKARQAAGLEGACSRYGRTNESEYFAENWAAYNRDPRGLYQHDPNGFHMVERALAKLERRATDTRHARTAKANPTLPDDAHADSRRLLSASTEAAQAALLDAVRSALAGALPALDAANPRAGAAKVAGRLGAALAGAVVQARARTRGASADAFRRELSEAGGDGRALPDVAGDAEDEARGARVGDSFGVAWLAAFDAAYAPGGDARGAAERSLADVEGRVPLIASTETVQAFSAERFETAAAYARARAERGEPAPTMVWRCVSGGTCVRCFALCGTTRPFGEPWTIGEKPFVEVLLPGSVHPGCLCSLHVAEPEPRRGPTSWPADLARAARRARGA